VRDLHAGQVVEPFGHQVAGRAGARRGERVFAGVRLEQGDEFARVCRRKLRRRDQQVWRQAHVGHGRQFALRFVGRFLQERIDGDGAARCGEQRIAVRGGLGRDIGAYHAAGARAVVDHDLLAEHFRHFLRHHAADEIGRLARRPRHDHAQGAAGIILRARGARDRQHGRE
jgi:hypothetical protein